MRLSTLFLSAAALALASAAPVPPITEGTLIPIDPYARALGEACPLKRTDVQADIAGPLARVRVTQQFRNESGRKIEAVYLFPLPDGAAVDEMTMTTGARVVKAVIKTREEARRTYEAARERGQTAALLEQERPNIFRQSVTNIEPGAEVKITISYVETVPYEEGSYEFAFPMTVGPRYKDGGNNPKYAPPATRAGHDLSLRVRLDAGLPVMNLRSKTHELNVNPDGANRAVVELRQRAVIPNKDFVLRYDVAGSQVKDALLTHRDARGGFFTFVLQPPARVTAEDVTPKEIVFVLDTSGSMSGFPIEKAKEAMKLAIDGLYPRDTFNLITFAGDTHLLFEKPVPATPENLSRAQEFLAGRRGGGGTEMMKAIRAALAPSGDRDAVRVVCFMTDGYVGNDMEIIAEIRKHSSARVFSFGIGSSVNRFLLDRMAREGRGEVEYVGLNEDGSLAARRFHERVRSPLLTDVRLEWNGLPVTDSYPTRVPDLFSAKPVIVHGRYTQPASGMLRVRGRMSGRDFVREVKVSFPAQTVPHDALASLWARAKVEDLMSQDWAGHQQRQPAGDLQQQITRLGLDFKLMTQYTSFVAVEEKTITRGGKPEIVEVPAEMPDGVSHQGVFGEAKTYAAMNQAAPAAFAAGGLRMERLPRAVAEPEARDAVRVRPQPMPPVMPPRKIQPSLLAVASRDEWVEVEIWLTEATPQVLAQLKALGFEEKPGLVAKVRRGRIKGNRLEQLAALSEVVGIRPPAAR